MALLVAACGGEASPNAQTVDAVGSTEAPASEAAAAEPASELFGTFTAIDNTQLDLADLEGQDVVLWFWAPW